MGAAEGRDLSQHRRKARGTGLNLGPGDGEISRGCLQMLDRGRSQERADGALPMGKGMNPQAMSVLCGAPWI